MQRNKILMIITLSCIIINAIFSMLVIWIEDLSIGAWYILWALAQLWIFVFIISNIDKLFKKKRKRSRFKSTSKINMK